MCNHIQNLHWELHVLHIYQSYMYLYMVSNQQNQCIIGICLVLVRVGLE